MTGDPEWRFDPLTGRRVLISPNRGERPLHVGRTCPFCEAHESETPNEVLSFGPSDRAPNTPGWVVRVVPNLYAALRMDLLPSQEFDFETQGEDGARWGAFNHSLSEEETKPGIGVAEVFLECPHHETRFRNLDPRQITEVLRAWQERLQYWRADGRLAFAQIFKNEGSKAGASVEHCHSQLIGVPFIPPAIEVENRLAGPECGFCRLIEKASESSVFVSESVDYVTMCPPAPRVAGETWIMPRNHEAAFEDTQESRLPELAGAIRDLLVRVSQAFGDPHINLIVKSIPFGFAGCYHWRIEILPRTVAIAGWEWSTGLVINTMTPERAATMLRGEKPTRHPLH